MILRGVLFRSTIRGGHASLAVASSDGDDEKVLLVVVRFGGSEWNANCLVENNHGSNVQSSETMTRMRSNVRRICKIGNELEFVGSFEDQTSEYEQKSANECYATKSERSSGFNDWNRFFVDYHLTSNQDDIETIRLIRAQSWDATRCQLLQKRYFPATKQKQQPKPKRNAPNETDKNESGIVIHHKSGLGKRQMGEVVADFLLFVLSTMHREMNEYNTQSAAFDKAPTKAAIDERFDGYKFKERIIPYIPNADERNALAVNLRQQQQVGSNKLEHSGCILDVAGGAGHVSLALTLRNVRSTVVDPRSTVGSLPARDRKLLKKSKKDPFNTYRAWFGSRPEGIDTFFREGCRDYFVNTTSGPKSIESIFGPDKNDVIPVCTIDSEDQLLPNCMAIVALHPDEATGVIVETAVKHRIPFVVV